MQLRHRTFAKGCYRILLTLVVLTSAVHADDKQTVRREVKRHIPEIARCFETHGDHDARVLVDFVIARTGRVASAAASGDGNRALKNCIAGRFLQMTFPAPAAEMKVRYPVHIITAGQ